MISNSQRLTILNELSDKLWDDYKSNSIPQHVYAARIEIIRKEFSLIMNSTYTDLQDVASKVGYILMKKPKSFSNVDLFYLLKSQN